MVGPGNRTINHALRYGVIFYCIVFLLQTVSARFERLFSSTYKLSNYRTFA